MATDAAVPGEVWPRDEDTVGVLQAVEVWALRDGSDTEAEGPTASWDVVENLLEVWKAGELTPLWVKVAVEVGALWPGETNPQVPRVLWL